MIGVHPADSAVESLAGLSSGQTHRFIQAGAEGGGKRPTSCAQELRDLFVLLESPPRGQFDPELARDGSEGFHKDAHMFLPSWLAWGW